MLTLAKAGLAIRRLSLSILCLLEPALRQRVCEGFPSSVQKRCCSWLVAVLFEVAGCPFSELCVHPDVGLHPRALPEAEGPVNLEPTACFSQQLAVLFPPEGTRG